MSDTRRPHRALEPQVGNVWSWIVTPTTAGLAVRVVVASCPRIAAREWGMEALREGAASVRVTMHPDDYAALRVANDKKVRKPKVAAVFGPFRVERLGSVTYAGLAGDMRPAPRWRLE